MLDGWVNGSNFLLYKDFERLKKAEASFKKATEYLATTQELSFTKENKDVCADLIKSIQEAEKSYLNCGKQLQEIQDVDKLCVDTIIAARDSVQALAKRYAEIGQIALSSAMLSEFYEIRISGYVFRLQPSAENQKKFLVRIDGFIADSRKYLSEFADDGKTHKLIKQLIPAMEDYKKGADEYGTSRLKLDPIIAQTSKLINATSDKIDILIDQILTESAIDFLYRHLPRCVTSRSSCTRLLRTILR